MSEVEASRAQTLSMDFTVTLETLEYFRNIHNLNRISTDSEVF